MGNIALWKPKSADYYSQVFDKNDRNKNMLLVRFISIFKLKICWI